MPLIDRRQWDRDFQVLIQGKSTVSEYAEEFERLARYAPELVRTEMQRVQRFVYGLNSRIRRNLGADMEKEKFETAVERALQAEMDERGIDEEQMLYQSRIIPIREAPRVEESTSGARQPWVRSGEGIQIGYSGGQQSRGQK